MTRMGVLAALAPHQPEVDQGWANRVIGRARQPTPLFYTESPWMPRVPDYDGVRGRVYDPYDVMRSLTNPPTFASEYGASDLPGYFDVPPQAPPPYNPWWRMWLGWWR